MIHIFFTPYTYSSYNINAPQKIPNKNMNLSRHKQKYWIINLISRFSNR